MCFTIRIFLRQRGADSLPVISWQKVDDANDEIGRVTMVADQEPDSIRGMRAVTLPNST